MFEFDVERDYGKERYQDMVQDAESKWRFAKTKNSADPDGKPLPKKLALPLRGLLNQRLKTS